MLKKFNSNQTNFTMKRFFIMLAICVLQTMLFAQKPSLCDTIVLKNDKTILANIAKTTDLKIFYHKCGDTGGNERTLNKSFVKEIRTFQGAKKETSEVVLPSASDTTQLWHIQIIDGNDYFGPIISQNSDKVVIRTKSLGEIGIPKYQIKVFKPVKKEQIVNGDYWYNSPHNTRHFWSPNGYGLRRGEGYYQNTWVLLNQVTYGFTDNFSIGVGMIPTFLFGASGFPFWVTPKFSLPLQKDLVNLGVGVMYINAVGLGLENEGGAGVTYGVLTLGPRDRNMTLGLGYGFAGGDWAKSPTLTLSGMLRATKKFSFLTENYLFSIEGERSGIISVGGRYGGKNIAVDFGLFAPLISGEDFFFALPWLGLNVPFGKHR